MILPIFQVDAFADEIFRGNPAAVCILDEWLPDELMQKIAMENNLAETAFIVEEPQGFRIRWFTPAVEVDLCGHATLASAHVFFNHLAYQHSEISFQSRSGLLKVLRSDNLLTLDFPADEIFQLEYHAELISVFRDAMEVWRGKTDFMVVLKDRESVELLRPDFKQLSSIEARGVIVTAPSSDSDFVSRFFAPQSGIDEDPVTGSAHTTLTVYWSNRLKKAELSAVQLSARKGFLKCKKEGSRIKISGQCKTFMIGQIYFGD